MDAVKLTTSCWMAAVLALDAVAGTVYVDNKLSDYTGHDGSSWQMAYKTIQEGVDAAADGDTVLVAPGTYGDDQGTRASSLSGATLTTRVLLPSAKAVTVKSSEGKAKTHIVGKKGTGTAGTGTGAVAGFVIENVSGGKGLNSRVEGFTIREVAPSAGVRGGGISFLPNPGNRTGIASLPWVVDCVISNASASAGILGNVNCARTWVTDITVDGNNTACGQNINAIHSVFTHCTGIAVGNCDVIANCYFADFGNRVTSTSAPNKIYNTIIQFTTSQRVDAVNGYDFQDNIFNVGSLTLASGAAGTFANTLVKSGSQVVNLPLGDFRPLASHAFMSSDAYKAGAANHGSASWLELFPEEFRYVDFYGKPFTPENGKVHAGASQELVTPESCIKLQRNVSINGSQKFVVNTQCEVYSDRWPLYYRLTPHLDSGKKLMFYKYSVGVGDAISSYLNMKPATKGDEAILVPDKGSVWTLSAVSAVKELWVDRDASAGGDGTEAAPFQSIQDAVNATGSSTSYVHVASGVYDQGEYGGQGATSNRVQITSGAYRFVATDGPENTVIRGAADTTSENASGGCGPAAVRCIYAANVPAVFDGFTLTDGHVANTNNAVNSAATRGGALLCDGTRPALVNCIVTNNCATRAVAMFKGAAYRCRFYDNTWLGNYVFEDAVRIGSCLIGRHDVPADNSVFFPNTVYVAQSTIRNYTNRNMVLASAHGYVFNTIVNHARHNSANSSQKRIMGCVFNDFTYNSNINTNGIHYVKKDPLFVDDTEHGDWRLLANSPAFGAGTAWDGLGELGNATAYETYYALVTHDLAGDEPFFVNGKPTSGAYQRPARIAVPVAPKGSSFSFTGAEDGTVAFNEPVTVTLSGGAREVYGIEIGGVVVDGLSATFMPADVFLAGGALDIRALVSTNWYADAVNGVDDAAHHGRTPEAAKKTLEAAFEYADAGDVVHALPGTYDEGSMKSDEAVYLRSRVFIPEGVRLVSTDGAASTTIKGLHYTGAGNVFGFLGGLDSSNSLMRCVTMAPNTELRGFTLLDGGTFSNNCPVATGAENRFGGGVFSKELSSAANPSVFVRDCFIKNCGAAHGGGGYRGVYERCRFQGTMAQQGAGAATYDAAAMRNCIVDEVRGATSIDQPYLVVNCTIGKNNRNAGGNGPEGTGTIRARSDGTSQLVNVLFLGGKEGIPVDGCTNCVVPSATYLKTSTAERPGLVVAEVEVDENYRPVAGSANIDAGANFALSGDPVETDVHGTQRVYNGTVDVGAVEFDWRPQYKADLGGSRRLEVTAASSNALHTASGVQLSDAQSLEAVWRSSRGMSSSMWEVSQEGDGTLWLSVNGGAEEPVAPGIIRKRLAGGDNVFAFRFEGAGVAYLKNFSDVNGTLLLMK